MTRRFIVYGLIFLGFCAVIALVLIADHRDYSRFVGRCKAEGGRIVMSYGKEMCLIPGEEVNGS